ncbi:MAG: FkbM family methyltransferase [Boseongicola sp.]|nr:FkbM family methyltransferase [Boseongicola sp.]
MKRNSRNVHRWLSRAPQITPEGFLLSGHKAYFCAGWEAQERRFLKRIFPNTDLFINFGANHGFYCCLALACGVQTVAFEPIPENCAVMMKNVLANGWADRFSLFPVAVSNKTGLAEMHGLNRSDESLIPGFSRHGHLRSWTVPVHRVDDVIRAAEVQGRNSVILMDIEGAEVPALESAASLLRVQPKPIWLIEVLDRPPTGRSGATVFEIMQSFGYSAWAFDGASGLERVAPDADKTYSSRNFVFCQNDEGVLNTLFR